MSLPHALLTALAERPGSGLELAQRFDKSIGHFWSASHQQIYRELARLRAANLIDAEELPESRGQKKILRILPAGRSELKRWLGESDTGAMLKDSLMVRIRAEAALGSGDLIGVLKRRLQCHSDKLAQYEEIAQRDFSQPPTSRSSALHALILRSGLRHEQFWIDALNDAIEVMSDFENSDQAPSASGNL